MAAPCRKCGATKTEPVSRGLRYRLARGFGYELRKCARCRKLRLLDRDARTTSAGYAAGRSASETDRGRGRAYGAGAFRDPDDFHGCPRCGGPEFRRTRRRWLERVLSRPLMARCRACGYRFPLPQA